MEAAVTPVVRVVGIVEDEPHEADLMATLKRDRERTRWSRIQTSKEG